MRYEATGEVLHVSFYPTWQEFSWLLVTVVVLCVLGAALFRRWTLQAQTPPLPVVFLTWVVVAAAYLWVCWYLYSGAQSTRKLTVLMYCLAFWMVPMAYFSHMFLNSLATRTVERLTWLGTPMPDMQDFRLARKLAAMGDIEGAVQKYRSYTYGRSRALFGAANLLELDGQFERAAGLFRESASEAQTEVRPWAQAIFRLAKLCEYHLDRTDDAANLYGQIVTRCPESEYGRLASSKLARLRAGGARSHHDDADEPHDDIVGGNAEPQERV